MDIVSLAKINALKKDFVAHQEDFVAHQEDYATHLEAEMPHQFKDLENNKTYKFGFQLSAEGNPQLSYEEVV